jgi:RNA polymerase sigma factor for flagellar operon FliA
VEDLEGAGIPGLLAAVEAYDPEKDVEFAAYAQSRIRGAILDELRALDPLPRSLRVKAKQIERCLLRLQQRLLRAPSDGEVAEALAMPLETLHGILHDLRGGLQVSLDGGWPGSDEGREGGGGGSPEPKGAAPDPWQVLALKERRAVLAALLDELPPAERTVLSLYYYEELTMKEIGAVLEVTESRVSQIHSAALLRLRAQLQRLDLKPEDLRVDDERSEAPWGLARTLA